MLLRVIRIEAGIIDVVVPGHDWEEQVPDIRADDCNHPKLYIDKDGTHHILFEIPESSVPVYVPPETQYLTANVNLNAASLDTVTFRDFAVLPFYTEEDLQKVFDD